MNNRNFLLLIIFIILSAFTPKEKSMVGLYGKCGETCNQIELKGDSTFEYYIFYDVGGGSIIEGTWKVRKDTLILNTYNQPSEARGYKILDSTYNKTKEIQCLGRDSVPILLGEIIINHTDTVPLDIEGKALYNSEINDIQISGIKAQYDSFNITAKQYSKIIFFIDHFVCYKPNYMTDEKLIIKNNSLFQYSHCDGRYSFFGMKKTNIKNKGF